MRRLIGNVPRRTSDSMWRAVASGDSVLLPVATEDQLRTMISPDFWPWIERYPVHSLIIVPLRVAGRVIGAIIVARSRPDQPYTAADVTWLEELANRAALSIAAARLYADNLQRTRQLEQANKELDAFSYTVSHDLRSPLRAIDGFSRLLDEQYSAALPDQAKHYVEVVRRNAARMNALITDLLAFARLSRQPISKRPIDVTALVRDIVAEMVGDAGTRNVEISIGDLPAVDADAGLLRQVFANLLSNALKFTRQTDAPHIQVGSMLQDGETVYFVRDNGVGFDMQYANKLFVVFQRLHGEDQYEGTGVGLAIVQRIIQRHGGRIWAQAEVGKGATFYFILNSVAPDESAERLRS